MNGAPISDQTDGHVDARSVLDVLPRAIIVTSPEGRILVWNRRAESLYGWMAEEVEGRLVSEVLVALPDRDRADEILDVVRTGTVWEGDFTVLRRNGDTVRVWVSDRPLFDDSGTLVGIVGASEDVAEQRMLEQRAADLTDHLRLALQAGGLGTFRWDLATGSTEWDERLEVLFGLEPGGFDGTFEAWVALLHPEDRDNVLATVDRAVVSKGAYTVEHRVVWPDGSLHWLHGAGQVTMDQAGNVTGTIGCTRDVTRQAVAELEHRRLTAEAVEAAEQERIHRERLEVLGSINDALASARDRREVMVNVSRAAVPRLGDWCSIYVLPQAGSTVPEIETAHVDPAMVTYARELQERFPYDPASSVGMPRVIRTGTTEFYPVIDEQLINRLDTSQAGRDVVRNLVLRSSMAVPLVKRGRVLGGLQLIMSNSSRHYTDDDLKLAEAVAARVASHLENLRLSEEQRSIASELQASLLPHQLPAIPGVEVAVRYWANGEGVEVGGDFYDLFPLADEAWAVVIGDVCGTGPTAAGVTGLARHTIADAAWHGDDHATVLASLNAAMRRRHAESSCTALYGTLQSASAGMSFTFACAGHPLPIIARADGSAASLGSHGTLLGLFDEITTTTTTTSLEAGDTIVLYTDGATDVAPPHGLTTEELVRLVGLAAEHARSAEQLADRLHADLSSILPIQERHDDIALLILRLPR